MTAPTNPRGEATRRGSAGRRSATAATMLFVALLAIAFASAGCAPFQAPVSAPQGAFYSHTRQPLTYEFDHTAVGSAAPLHASSSSFYFYDPFLTGLRFAWDDISIAETAQRNGIETVSYADYETKLFLSVFGFFTIHVHGS